jgi:hypothetical protein
VLFGKDRQLACPPSHLSAHGGDTWDVEAARGAHYDPLLPLAGFCPESTEHPEQSNNKSQYPLTYAENSVRLSTEHMLNGAEHLGTS